MVYRNSLNFCAPYIFAPSNFYTPNFCTPLKYDLSRTLLFSRNIYFIKFFNTVLMKNLKNEGTKLGNTQF